jgi:hypothetical protein
LNDNRRDLVPPPFQSHEAFTVTKWHYTPRRRVFQLGHLPVRDLAMADTISSRDATTGLHRPLIDVDVPAWLIPSSTPGRGHLYVDKPMTWRQYRRILRALYKAGILEKRSWQASCGARMTLVRVPWLRKTAEWRRTWAETKAASVR